MKPIPNATLLFHLSDEPRASFSAPSDKRPAFYWFNDSYHSHILGDKPAYKYMYFFIVKPDSGVGLFTRHGTGDFTSMWKDHAEYRLQRMKSSLKGVTGYNEPGIVMSFSELVPVLIGEFKGDDYRLSVIKPEDSPVSFDLKEGGHFRLFNQIPELTKLCPDIKTSVPVLHPKPEQQPNTFWSPDTRNLGKMWI